MCGCRNIAPMFESQGFTLSASMTAATSVFSALRSRHDADDPLSSPMSASGRFTSESTAAFSDGFVGSFTIPCSRTIIARHPYLPLTPPTCCWNILVPRLGKCFHALGLYICTMLIDELAYFTACRVLCYPLRGYHSHESAPFDSTRATQRFHFPIDP